MTQPRLAALMRRIGYGFADTALLTRALTHRSAGGSHYERLEFLGDSLLNFVVAERLYAACPSADEGDLSRLRAALVREETLAAIAGELQLADVIELGGGALKSGVFRRKSVLADAVEALIGAILLDGGLEAARDGILRWWGERLQDLPDPATLKDPKTRLQEHLQGLGRGRPEYEVLEVGGPPHRQRFLVVCRAGTLCCEGRGASRRGAEQQAARAMLEQLDV